jgi:hypothetical protein
MAEIIYENQNDIVILRVIGGATFAEIAEAVKQHFPKVTRHLIWDYTNGNLNNVTAEDLKIVPDMSAKYFVDRKYGKTAFACPGLYTYGMFRMYTAFADMKSMPYEYGVHRGFEDALKWVMN